MKTQYPSFLWDMTHEKDDNNRPVGACFRLGGAPIRTESGKLWGSGGAAPGNIFRAPPFVLLATPFCDLLKGYFMFGDPGGKVVSPWIQIHVFSTKTTNLGQY